MFHPASTRLYVVIGDSSNGNFLIPNTEAQSLPLNVRTKITLECNGLDVNLTVGAIVYTAKQPTYRFAGNLIVYAGDPWWPAATAELYNLEYKILQVGANTGKDLQSLSCTRVCMHVCVCACVRVCVCVCACAYVIVMFPVIITL